MVTTETGPAHQIVLVKDQTDVVAARQAGRDMARDAEFGTADQTRFATAISELARNALIYAGEGTCSIHDVSDRDWMKIRAVVEDQGPGIPDLEKALTDGYSTGGSLGAGLPGAKRLVQIFDIDSEPGRTVVTIEINRRRFQARHDIEKNVMPRRFRFEV